MVAIISIVLQIILQMLVTDHLVTPTDMVGESFGSAVVHLATPAHMMSLGECEMVNQVRNDLIAAKAVDRDISMLGVLEFP